MPDNGLTPFSPALDWEGLAEALLQRAVALGRRDGLQGQFRDIAGAAGLPGLQAVPVPDVLLAAMRHCYTAGHAHGADVRREGHRRRAARPSPSLAVAAAAQA
ncbi:hypothetical protein E0493_19815 [Roseomonas sp. M0104]|uniref:Uncharacterized protein n=1 Tax=Teichococcus coralli TaxID=2545983 RepID=A0A845BQB5_9PROT|nr:hypothetical protein [Pseudoroseomonas coralli]MXP65599.1 hypothetical protein [Pseudoroseomonas coralli]